MRKGWQTLVGCSVALLGCSGDAEPVDIGQTQGAELSDYVDTWEGYAEGYVFSDGSDRVRLTLNHDGGGVFIVGDGPLVEPPVDPDVWPLAEPLIPEPGIEFPVTGAVVEERRVRVDVDLYVLARPWCELQTTALAEQSGAEIHACVPGFQWRANGSCFYGESDDPMANPIEVDCGKASMCRGPAPNCACDADGCQVPDEPFRMLDAAWAEDGEALVGTAALQGSRTVRLYRQP